MADYLASLKADSVEQFKGQPNIEALMEIIAEQLQDVAAFYEDLRTQRDVDTAIGKQLDGVGNIVVLSRAEAGQLASLSNPGEPINDDTYRKYLFYKILKNTCNCTYPDLVRAFRVFWEKPLYYHEDPKYPAVMFMETGILSPEDHVEDLLNVPLIKAAGVGIHVHATVRYPEVEGTLFFGVCAAMHVRHPIPEQRDTLDFHKIIHIGGEFNAAVRRPVPEAVDRLQFRNTAHAGGSFATHIVIPVPEQK